MKRIAAWLALGLVVTAGVAALGFRIWVGATAPALGGRETIPGLGDSVTVLWDSLAVPHILARSDSDAFAALGYLHARDRLWEMDLLRHAAEGRLSELFGARTVSADRALRAREMPRLARERLAYTGEAARRLTGAYARGVNAWLAVAQRPPELRLLGHTPEPWVPVHSVEIGLLESWDLRSDNGEISHARAVARLGAERAAELFVPYPDSGAVIVAGTSGEGPAVPGAASGQPAAAASNSWAIGPAHTRSGKPILANDPHLPLRAPSIWYLAGMHAPDYEVVGVTIPGLPGVVLGHTAHHGWGFTNGMIDDVDYVAERITPDSARYLRPSGWTAIEMVTETLLVKGEQPVIYARGRTADGPLVDVGWSPDSTTAFALRWTAQTPSDELTALLGMTRARSLAEFQAALEGFRTPEQNIVYADRDGNIAYFLAGRVPVRRAGDGALPDSGWSPAAGWDRFLTAAELPRAVNPASGFIVTANNRIVGDRFPIAVRADYDLPFRAQRIWEMVRRDSGATAATVAREQLDVVHVFLRRIAPIAADAIDSACRPHPPDAVPAGCGEEGTTARRLTAALRRWDGAMAADRVEPTLVWSWYRELQALTYDDESPGFRPMGALNRWLAAGDSPWFDDVRTPEREDLGMLARRAMAHVLARGTPRPWGEVHTHTEEHPLGGVPVLGRLAGFNVGPLHLSGGNNTVNVCPSQEYAPPFECTEGPSMRHVVDFGDVDGAGGFILPAGQSGNPRSPHYRDQTERWVRGELWVVPVDVARVRAVDTLRLVPE